MTNLHKDENHDVDECCTPKKKTTPKNAHATTGCCASDEDSDDHSGHDHDHGGGNGTTIDLFLPL